MSHLSPAESDQSLTVPTEFPTPIGPHDQSAQREWEHHQVTRGVQRYRESLVKETEDGGIKRRSLADLEPGQVIAQDLIGPMVEAITKLQLDVQEAEGKAPGNTQLAEENWILLALPATTLAAVAILHVLTKVEPSQFTSTAVALGTRVQHEWEYVTWRDAERKAKKDRKEAGDDAYVPDLFKLMHQRNTTVDDRVFKKWSKKSPLFTRGDWSADTRARIGSLLLTVLVEANAWFEVVVERQGPRQTRILKMTEAGQAFVADRHAQNELMRPYLLPMICEPQDYAYQDAQ